MSAPRIDAFRLTSAPLSGAISKLCPARQASVDRIGKSTRRIRKRNPISIPLLGYRTTEEIKVAFVAGNPARDPRASTALASVDSAYFGGLIPREGSNPKQASFSKSTNSNGSASNSRTSKPQAPQTLPVLPALPVFAPKLTSAPNARARHRSIPPSFVWLENREAVGHAYLPGELPRRKSQRFSCWWLALIPRPQKPCGCVL